MLGLLRHLAQRGIWIGTLPPAKQYVLTGTMTNQATGALVDADLNVLATVPSGTAVTVQPPNGANATMLIVNNGANAALVFPSLNGKILPGAANASFSLGVGKSVLLVGLNLTDWASVVSA